jgi:DNA-binding transcriptional ArsR family regulator
VQPIPKVQELDSVLHEKSRLAIVSILATGDALTFRELKEALKMTDGNLSVHLRVLESAGYVDVEKSFVDRKPRTSVRLSRQGRRALVRYVDDLEAILREVKVR